jgi:1-phosphofructokinase
VITTLTVNPSLDHTLEVTELRRGQVTRATGTRVDPGGKGVNVSRALQAAGRATRAVVACGGPAGAELAALLAAEGIETVEVPVSGSVRSNISVVEPDGTVTKINEAGPTLGNDDAHRLTTAVLDAGEAAEWVVLSGSLAPGLDPGFYAELVERLTGRGVRVAVDTSGAALPLTVAAGPDLVKPNLEELAEVTGSWPRSLDEIVTAAERLRDKGAGAVLASLGADGAVLVADGVVAHGTAPVATVRSTVGAGDALLSGYLIGGGGLDGLRHALAWGAAATALPGSRMPGPTGTDLGAVRVTDLTAAGPTAPATSHHQGGHPMTALITAGGVDLDLTAADRKEATAKLAARLAAAGRVTDLDGFLADVAAREQQMPTGIEGGIGIPHARSAHVTAPSLAFGRVAGGGVDFGAEDGPADLVFLIAAPDGEGNEHMKILSSLARRLMHDSFRATLRHATDPAEVVDLVEREVAPR